MKKFFKIVFGIVGFIIFIMVVGLMEETKPKDEVKKEKVKKVKKVKKEIKVSFNKLHQSGNLIVCYTEDSESLWMNKEWTKKIKQKMSKLKSGDLNVLLFNSKKNTPNVNKLGFDYPQSYDKHMVCGFWRFNYEKFCYGGIDSSGNFLKCEE